MENQVFRLKEVPRIAWDFHSAGPDYQKKGSKARQPETHDAALQVAGTQPSVADSKKPSHPYIPTSFFSMPAEIQGMIWAEKMRKPGLYFLAVHVPHKATLANCNEHGVRKIKLTEPCHKIYEKHEPYRSYFPNGIRSAYHQWADLSTTFPFARPAMKRSLVKPLTIATHNNLNITIDAATDLLYLKFHWKPGKNPSQCVPSPAYWMLILDFSELRGIRHVAIELNKIDTCIFWPSDPNELCGACGIHKDEHDDEISSELWLVADFLHCLESVYIVFNDIKQGPFHPQLDPRYTVSGQPDAHARSQESRWDTSSDPVFRGDGGSVRELRSNHIILPVAHIVETLQAYYVYHNKTAIGDLEAVSKRTKAQRYPVLFKMAAVTRDE
ncbi:hypothetical protein GE09DRAFT_541600 [Coniochaeta sp. 2T2.1]|nr:hypothetical protein GE09DRAFT_541600 [Coniochaeta sp. 2T2.1]